MTGRGFDPAGLAALWQSTAAVGSLDERFTALESVMTGDGADGVRGLRTVVRHAIAMGVSEDCIQLDPALARGADYYTGAVFEAVVEGSSVGSIVGGGRYDTLVGRFSGKDIPAVGLSLGMDRILLVMEDAGLLPVAEATADVLVTMNDPATQDAALQVARALRDVGVATEIYLGSGRMKAQFKYAGRRGHRVLALLEPHDMDDGTVTLRVAKTRQNLSVSLDDVGRSALNLLQSLDPSERDV
ncbi:MAG: histidyl-tRNA synthetase [Kiritimatiellia bacterium]